MIPQTLVIHGVPKTIGESLSALVRVGADFWLGADEGTSVARANAEGGIAGAEWSLTSTYDLVPQLALPGKIPDIKGLLPEVDVEGMDWDGLHLWMVGSHSLKRKQPKIDESDEENWNRLAKVEVDGNRYLLARLPLDQAGDMLKPNAASAEHCAARLPCDLFSSDLLREMRTDKLFARFLRIEGEDSKKENLPGKDNGIDIEGLAVIGRDQLLVGLRGPVMRGFALVLELRLACDGPPDDCRPATLNLQFVGERKYRRLAFKFNDLEGLGVRDLCFDENGDLLILAGPTMVLPWPVLVFRWPGARERLAADTKDRFIWPDELREELRYFPSSAKDHAESLCILGSGEERRLIIGYDNKARWSPTGELTAGNTLVGDLRVDAFPLL